jgi:DNA-binding HxlR family transcriptional regulator
MEISPILTARCPIRTSLELLGGKWKLLLIQQLKDETKRYGQLKSALPDVSEKMLTQELRQLVSDGLLLRTDYREVPPRVDYSLTPLGREVIPLIEALATFGNSYQQQRL